MTTITIYKPRNFIAGLILINALFLVIGIAFTLAFVQFSGMFVTGIEHKQVVAQFEEKILDLENQKNLIQEDCNIRIAAAQDEVKEKEIVINKQNKLIDNMNKNVDFITSKYYYIFELVNKYKTPNAIKYSNLVKLDEECKERNVDPHMMLGLYNLESKFNTKAESSLSSAKGIAQIIKSTGEFLYKDYLGYEGKYNHEVMAKDANLSIEMSVVYIQRLMNSWKDPDKALYSYNGGEIGSEYYERVNKFIASRGLPRTTGRYR